MVGHYSRAGREILEDYPRRTKGTKMKKSVLPKTLRNHSFAMILCCAIPFILFLVLSLTGSLGSWGFYSLILLCPLLHVILMRGHISSVAHEKAHALSTNDRKGPQG